MAKAPQRKCRDVLCCMLMLVFCEYCDAEGQRSAATGQNNARHLSGVLRETS